MARSGSYNFTLNRDNLIKQALIEAHVIDYNTTPDAPLVAQTATLMNLILKEWQADGLNLWSIRPFTIFMEADKTQYSLGPTGDHATESYVETAMRVAAVALDTTMEVDSTTGMTAGDYALVQLDDGTLHRDTVASVTDSNTFELTSGIASAAAVDNAVYTYTTKIQRPLRILDLVLRDSSGNDTGMTLVSREEYWNLAQKTSESTPNLAFYDKQLDNGKLWVFPEPSDVTDSIEAMGQFPFDDMDTATDNLGFPGEWNLSVVLEVAYRTAARFAMPKDFISQLFVSARESKARVMGYDTEDTSIFLKPESR